MAHNVWTDDKIVNSPFGNVEIPNVTISEYIWRNIDKWMEKTALVCGVTDRSLTYKQLYEYSRNFAINLRTRFQIKDGDVIGFMMPNALEFPIAVIGAMQAGAIISTINPLHNANEVHRQLLMSKPKLIVSTTENAAVVQEAIRKTKYNIVVVTVQKPDETAKDLPNETISFNELIVNNKVNENVLNNVKRKSEDVVFLLYSSGTTGLPKGVELIHRNIVANFVQQEVFELRQYVETTDQHQDRVLAILPFYHVYGLTVVLLHKLAIGAKVVIIPKFQPTIVLNALTKYKINILYIVPTLTLFLSSHPEVKNEHLASLDTLICGAAPTTVSDLQKVLDRCQPNIKCFILYGLTETSPVATSTVPGSQYQRTTVGFAVANCQLKVLDSNERNLGPNEVGELYIRGPQVMKAYRDNPEATKAAITDDGWFRTGDLVSINADGAVTMVDRIKEIIKVKGYQVPPAELEKILKEHPAVLDAAVIGIPDDKRGEIPKAFVVLKQGHETTANNIKDFVNKNLSEYKYVREVEFIDALPRDTSGKLLRRVLKNNIVETDAEIKGLQKYGSITQDHVVLPFGVETLVPWESETKLVFKHFCKRLLDSTNDPRAGLPRQRISLAIQRGNIASILGI